MEIVAVSIVLPFRDNYTIVSASTTLFVDELTWNDANQYCRSIGQNLVKIGRQAKEHYLHEHLLNINPADKDIWIGLHAPDPNQQTNRVWTNNCSSSLLYSNWKPGLNSGICNSGIFYDTESHTSVATEMNGLTTMSPVNVQQCKNACNPLPMCWGFVFIPSVPKCALFDVNDDPLFMENNQEYAHHHCLYMKRCNFEVDEDTNVLSVPPYDSSGSVAVSDCVTTTNEITSEYHTITRQQTTISFVSTKDQTTAEKMIPSTNANHVTSSNYQTITSKPETTSMEMNLINPTTEYQATSEIDTISIGTESNYPTTNQKVKKPYCICTCNNVTKPMSLKVSITEIVNAIKVNKSQTSTYRRQHTCAWDSRKSSASIGYVGIVILVSIASLLICIDSSPLIYKITSQLNKPTTNTDSTCSK
ncbi:MRC [Mytilus coruscus]|uniref:MRC n=1 Tax=Mytilus coruscus TaxID=42192 RepID=A0A6J8C5E9_MYTCO|nr:MRC [Mytilus coruscus]